MVESTSDNRALARRKAEDQFNKRERLDTEIRLHQQNRWDAETAKIARLKSLRLARDAEISKAGLAEPKATGKKKICSPPGGGSP
jgi:hypothetical protein